MTVTFLKEGLLFTNPDLSYTLLLISIKNHNANFYCNQYFASKEGGMLYFLWCLFHFVTHPKTHKA